MREALDVTEGPIEGRWIQTAEQIQNPVASAVAIVAMIAEEAILGHYAAADGYRWLYIACRRHVAWLEAVPGEPAPAEPLTG